MKLVIMTQPTFFVEEDKILTALFEEGMEHLHLCKPGTSPMYSERLLSLLPDMSYSRITVHDHYYLKSEYGLAGIHIDAEGVEPPKDYKGKFSVTCNNTAELPTMKKKSEYVFLNNCFEPHGGHGRTLDEAARLGLIDKHVYAFGGVRLDNIKEAKELGFGGVVVCDDLWDKFDIHSQLDYKELINHFERLRKAAS